MRRVAGRFSLLAKVISDLSVGRPSYGHIWTGNGVDLASWIRSNTLSQLWPHSPKKSASRPWHAMPCSDRTSTKAFLYLRRHVMPASRSDPFSVGLPDTVPPGWLGWQE